MEMRLLWLCAVLGGCHLGSAEVEVTCEDWAGGCEDMDRDGFTGDADCDPSNGAINPAATDVSGDDIDQNCDGEDGIAGAGTVVDEDQDNDGYRSDEECDDGNGAINPSATDVQGDGTDQNCDGADGVDSDGDGQAAAWSSGTDCDDGDAGVYAGAPDPGGDGVDADCDGEDGPPGPGVFYGDLTLGSEADIAWFCGSYDRIVGTLTLAEAIGDLSGLACLQEVSGTLAVAAAAPSLELPMLSRVGGQLTVRNDLQTLDLSALVEVGGALSVWSDSLGSASFPALISAGGLDVYGVSVGELSAPLLGSVAGDVRLYTEADVRIDLSALATARSVSLSNTDGAATVDLQLAALVSVDDLLQLNLPLDTFTLNRLASARYVQITDAAYDGGQINLPALTATDSLSLQYIGVAAPVLTQTGEVNISGGATVASFAALTTLDYLYIGSSGLTHLNGFSALRTVSVEVYLYGNSSLASVSGLSGLTTFDTLTFYYNAPVTDSQIYDLMSTINATSYNIYGNG